MRRTLILFSILTISYCSPLVLFSQSTIEWDGSLDGDGDNTTWDDPLNWDMDRVPNQEDIVYIGLEGAGVVIDNSDTVQITSLTLSGVSVTIQSNSVLKIVAVATSGLALEFGATLPSYFYNEGSLVITSIMGAVSRHGLSVSNDCEFHNEQSGFIHISDFAGTNSSAIRITGGLFNNQGFIETFDTKDDHDIKMFLASSIFINDGLIESKNSHRTAEFYSFAGTIKGAGLINIAKFTASQSLLDPGPFDPFQIEEPAIFTISGDADILFSTIKIDIRDIYGPGQVNGHDQIVVKGDLKVSDTIRVAFLNAYFPDSSDYINVIKYDGMLTGTFDVLDSPSPIMDHWDLDYSTNPGRIILYNTFCTMDNFKNCLNDPCPLWSGHYKVSDQIQYAGGYEIPTGEIVILDAKISTTFPMDFEVKLGAELEIRTDGCNQ